MSDITDRLEAGRLVAWAALVPVFEHAIAVAREREYEAEYAANVAMSHVPPAYPPLVELLANAAPPTRGDVRALAGEDGQG